MRTFQAAAQGVALMEFAIVLPAILLLAFGGIELSRYSLTRLKVDKAAYILADIIAQTDPATVDWTTNGCTQTQNKHGLTETDATNAMNQFDRIMLPYNSQANQMVFISSVTKTGGTLTVKWQTSGGGSLTQNVTSIVTGGGPQGICCRGQLMMPTGDVATQTAGLANNENMVIVEVFYFYQPIAQAILQQLGFDMQPINLVRRVFLHPRKGDHEYIHDTYPPPPPLPPPLPPECTGSSSSGGSSSGVDWGNCPSYIVYGDGRVPDTSLSSPGNCPGPEQVCSYDANVIPNSIVTMYTTHCLTCQIIGYSCNNDPVNPACPAIWGNCQ